MRICRFENGDGRRVGCISEIFPEKVLDISDLVNGADLSSLMQQDALQRAAENADAANLLDLADAALLPPVGRPGKIVCLAGNYGAHITESGYVEPGARTKFTQQLFLKPSTSLIGDGGVIELDKNNHRVGWETELAVIIGKGGKNVAAGDAYDHVFGYTILNDLSERGLNSDIRDRHVREMDGFCDWLAGKWFDGFAPCGPWAVTKDKVEDPHNLAIKFYLNGELRQDGSTRDMLFSIPEQIEYVSSIMTLEPGDIISTGTPAGAGVGDARTSLADGDEMVCEIEGIGRLTNTVRWNA